MFARPTFVGINALVSDDDPVADLVGTPGPASSEHFKGARPRGGTNPQAVRPLTAATAIAELWLAVVRAAPQSEEKPAGDTTL